MRNRGPRHTNLTAVLFLVAALTLAACVPAPDPTPTAVPTLAEPTVAETATAESQPTPEPTPEPTQEEADADSEPAATETPVEEQEDAAAADETEPAQAEVEQTEVEAETAESVAYNSWTVNQLFGIGTLGGVPVTAEFISNAELTGWTGCNDYEATFVTGEGAGGRDNTIEVTELTLISDNPCRSEAATNQELLFQKALNDAETYELSGADLTLYDASGAAVLTMRNTVTLELIGTSWAVTGYDNTTGEFVPVIADGPALSMMLREGAVNGFSGCNNYAGTAQVSGNSVTIDNVSNDGAGAGSAACEGDSPLVNQEAQYRKALTVATTWEIAGPNLTLYGADGDPVAVYLAASAQEDASE